MWSRCIVCGKLKKDEELATITLYGRRAEACTMCAGEAGLSGPEHFSERPEIIEDLVKRWKKGRKKRCLTRLEALRDGLFPEPEQVREWATLAKTDFKSFRMRLSGLPFLADKLSILMDACGLNGFDACAVLFGWQKDLDNPVTMYGEKIAKVTQFLVDHGFPGDTAKSVAINAVKCFAPLYRKVIEWEEAEKRRREEAARRQEEEERRQAETICKLGKILGELPGWNPEATGAFFADLRAKASSKPRTKRETEMHRRALRLLELLETPDPDRKELLKALTSYAQKREKSLPEWVAEVASLGWKFFAGQELREEIKRRAKEREAEAKFRAELATEKEFVKALRHRLDVLGVTEPLTSDRYEKFRRMLPERLAELFRLKHRYHLFGWSNSEPPWVRETPDEIVLATQERLLPDRLLLRAWHDRWVTVRTAAEILGVSPERIRSLLPKLTYIEVENPHGNDAPMRLIRLSSLFDWAEKHREEVERWAEASARAKAAYRRAFERKVQELHALPEKIAGVSDSPAPLVCFWLSLLNRAAKSGRPELYRMKDDALRVLKKKGVPFELAFIEGGDREEKVWLCDECLERAYEMDMHPLEYIDAVGPCENCDIEPAEEGYYDLYELTFTFPGVGRFCFHVPYPIGKEWLPNPDDIPEEKWRVRGEEGEFLFGRPLNKVEAAAFSVEEIVRGLQSALGALSKWHEEKRDSAT